MHQISTVLLSLVASSHLALANCVFRLCKLFKRVPVDKISSAISVTIVKKRKLKWFGRLLFIRSGQNHLARHSERGKKTRQIEKEVGRQHQGMDRLGVRQVPEGNGEQKK